MIKKDISEELWREYDFGGRIYRIDNPQVLYFKVGGSTHRIEDKEGIVHCVPAPGFNGCVLRWLTKEDSDSVLF